MINLYYYKKFGTHLFENYDTKEMESQKEHVTRSLKIKGAAMPPLGAASE